MVKHDNIHRIEWPLGVITAIYPDERGVVRTAEMEECGHRSLRSVTYLVPLELDCHRNDGDERQRLREDHGGDDDDDRNFSSVDSTSEAGGQGSPIQTADAEGRSIPHGASPLESTLHHTSGSSRASSPTIGTTEQCSVTTEGDAGTPHTLPLPPSQNSSVAHQTSMGEGSEAGAGEPATELRQPRAAALRQRRLMKSLLNDDLL